MAKIQKVVAGKTMENDEFISVLIPALNEEKSIRQCIVALKEQDFCKERYEIIVMDNGSIDRTREIAESLGVKVLDASGRRIGAVRNLGAQSARGNILAYVDADCIVDSDWLKNGEELLTESDRVGAVGGRCFAAPDATWVQRAWVFKDYKVTTKDVNILSTGSFFVKKNVFLSVGGFNESLAAGEDTEISRKIKESGWRLVLSSLIGVAHMGLPATALEFIKRQIWQSTDYLKTLKNKKDPVFILVHIFLISILFSVASILVGALQVVSIFALIITILVAVGLTIYRQLKNERGGSVKLFLQYLILNYLYLVGRSIGLLKSYFRVALEKS